MSEPTDLARARFVRLPVGNLPRAEYPVHFNPTSLQYTVSNTMQEQGKEKKQYVTKSTAKLTMDLVFDTTHNGSDVRGHTQKIAALMGPPRAGTGPAPAKQEKYIPPVVVFEWGTYKFQGILEAYKETLDFFAPTGVPLRSSINVTLSSQEKVFEPSATGPTFDTQGALRPEPVVVPSAPDNGGASGLADQAGNPAAARAVGTANNQESLRFPSGPSMAVDPSIPLAPPVAFASGGPGAGAGLAGGLGLGGGGIGGGLGLGGGISGGVGGGFSLDGGGGLSFGAGATGGIGLAAGGSAGFQAGAGFTSTSYSAQAGGGLSLGGGATFGGSASAGVSASAGAFAGLRQPSGGRPVSLDVGRLLPRSESFELATDSRASFQLGGQASIEGSTSLSADVGARASLRARIQFEER